MAKANLFGTSRPALAELMGGLGQPGYRAGQVYAWLYAKRVRSIAEMTDLAKELRARLEETHELAWPEPSERSDSRDGTRKYLFALAGGATVESVYIPDEERRTICISTQAGCPLACAFCLTGVAGYQRNLKPAEILGQVAAVMADNPGHPAGPELPWNVVMMGMGEPLLNYEATVASLRVLLDPEGFGIAPRKLTLSTVGILPALEKLMEEPVRPNLAISLHAPNPTLRRALMPIEEKYPLDRVVDAALRYPIPSGGAVTFEYVLLQGVNDDRLHARELARRLRGRRLKVNLIPLNPAEPVPFRAPSPAAVDAFCGELAAAGVPVSVRRARGQDILAACGQLHLKREAEARP